MKFCKRILISALVVVLIGTLFIGACDPGTKAKPRSYPQLNATVYEFNGPSGFMADKILIVRLRDGTRCAIHYAGGISCDWRKVTNKNSQHQ
jgi:hypothetical protein